MITPQGNDQYITELDVRIWLRDNDPSANELIDDVEFSPEEIRTAMTLAVDKWNDTPPYLGAYEYDKFPFRSALLTGTTANLLFIAANRYRRNKLNYNVPGGAVNDKARDADYDSAGERLSAKYDKWIQHNKRAINMDNGFGIIT